MVYKKRDDGSDDNSVDSFWMEVGAICVVLAILIGLSVLTGCAGDNGNEYPKSVITGEQLRMCLFNCDADIRVNAGEEKQ